MATIDWKTLYCTLADLYREMDFEESNDQVCFELSEYPKDPEILTEKYEEFCKGVQDLWDSQEWNESHQVYVEYSESDHMIFIAIKRCIFVPSVPGWAESVGLKDFIESNE